MEGDQPPGAPPDPGSLKPDDEWTLPGAGAIILPMKRLGLLPAALLFLVAAQDSPRRDWVLWYEKPAAQKGKTSAWVEALPVGNGRLGAMVFGGVPEERLQLNEHTCWTGRPHAYHHEGASKVLPELRRLLAEGKQKEAESLAMKEFMSVPLRQMAYQPLGDLRLSFPGHEKPADYRRELDLDAAVARVAYTIDGVPYERQVFSSFPDQALVVRLTAGRKGALRFTAKLESPHKSARTRAREDGALAMSGRVQDDGIAFEARLQVEAEGGTAKAADGALAVEGADAATLRLVAHTNHKSYRDLSADPAARCEVSLKAASAKTFDALIRAHQEDHRRLFRRVSIDLGRTPAADRTTDRRVGTGAPQDDPHLAALYFQYGRYLLIASSRPGSQPANLQGLWNEDLKPAWDSKYTTNINAEMNYWPAEATNLAECHEPLFRLIEECAETGRATARVHYGADGWVLHHNTDLWRGTAPINHSNHGMWMGGSGWVSRHMWEHFLFTRDRDFLRDRAWPVMREAARFYTRVLVPDPKTGWLISAPSNSPEIGGLVAGPTMDHQIIRSLFAACVEAAEILGQEREFAAELARLIPRIAPNRIGRLGQLQEWMEDIDDPDEHHRHVSHLWGVHPGADITWEKTPELMKAARQSLRFRGDDGTGWSLAWKINFWARFLDGDHAYELIKLLLRVKDESTVNWSGGSYINLFDSHPPFQIDGNFGGAAGIVEMLVQSHQGFIDVLPALPAALRTGSLRGVCARGGFELDMSWKDGRLTRLSVLSKAGEPCKIRFQGKVREFPTEKGKRYPVTF